MPFISELKVVDTLYLQDSKTTVTVHLIYLEGLTETNFVYLSHSSITSPPAQLDFTSPDGHTKPGDVLLWASARIPNRRGSCGRVHQCWMYDGTGWIKRPDLHSSLNGMQHPVHSDHRLVVSSGPFVEWELKPALYFNDSDSSPTPDSANILAHLDAQAIPSNNSMVMKGLQGSITSESDLEEIERTICATKNKTPRSAELSNSCLESLEMISPSRLHKTDRGSASRIHREPQLDESLRKTADSSKVHKDPASIAYVKRHRPSSLSPLSRKKRRTTINPDESKPKNLQTTLQHPEGSSPSVVAIPLPLSKPTYGAASSSQVCATTQAADHSIASSRETISTAENDLETQRGVNQGQKGEFSMAHAMLKEIEQLHQALSAQKTRVSDLEVSLGTAKEDLAAQKIEAKKREEASQKELDLVTEELVKKNQLAIRLAEEVDLVKLRVEELQQALATSGNELQIQKDRAAYADEAIELAQRLGKDLQDWISELEGQRHRDQELITATQANLSRAQATAAQYRRDISTQKVALLKEVHRRKSLRQIVKSNAERHAQERITLERELENQKAEFREYLAISDRERGKVEQQFFGQKASLELNLETTIRGLASMEAECSKLKNAYTAEVLQLNNTICSSKTALEYSQQDAVAKQMAAEHEMTVLRCRIADLTRDLEAAHLEMARMKSAVSDERDKFQEMLRVNKTHLGQELSNLREQLAQENGEREQIKKECEVLKREIGERNLLLEEAQATCLRLTKESSSLQDQHVTELSQRQVVYEGKIQSLGQELEDMRTSHSTTLREIAGLRREVKDALVNNADMKQKIKETQSLLESKVSENMALQDQHAKALASERWKRENTEKILEAVKEECREPFVIPMLLECFVGAHKEASYLSGSEDGEVHES